MYRKGMFPKIILLLFISALFVVELSSCKDKAEVKTSDIEKFKDGDLIFQESKSRQSKAIKLATGSKYSHMGIIYRKGDKIYVYEAVQPVKLTPLHEWVKRGIDGEFVLKRLKNADEVLTPETIKKMKNEGKKFLGRDYDSYFEWSDKRMYCSEIVWKLYKRTANIEIGKLRPLRDFNLEHKAVKAQLKKRYGDKIPLDEQMISPGDMFDSELLFTVLEN